MLLRPITRSWSRSFSSRSFSFNLSFGALIEICIKVAVQFELKFGPWRFEAERSREGWLQAGNSQVRLRFVRNTRARRYVLRLRPDGTARVTIPRGGTVVEAKQFAESNRVWLEKQLLRQASRPRRPQEWLL